MRRIGILGLCAAGAIAFAGGAYAHGGGGGGGGGMGCGMGGGMDHGMGPMSTPSSTPSTAPTTNGRTNSQGPSNVSTTGGEHANAHSVVAGAGTPTGPLASLSAGMTVKDTSGKVIGTVSKVIRSSGGVVRNVLVTPASTSGLRRHTLPLRPSSLSLSGGAVITTQPIHG